MPRTHNEKLLIRQWAEEDEICRKAHNYNIVVMVAGLLMAVMVLWATVVRADEVRVDMGIIADIESSGHPDAYNRHSGAVGLCQITAVVLKEYNIKHKTGHTMKELYTAGFNMAVADWYMNVRIPQMLRAYNIEDTTRNRLWAYNAGIGNVVKHRMPEETKSYIVKYEGRAK